MNVQVLHKGVDITNYVISYEREHRICSGIGMLDIQIDRSCPRSFSPWDDIKIYENGDFKVKYYVSDITDSIPTGVKTLKCQDNSKRLVDYFIPDSYTIDYPTYTRYWIEKFLDEAGVNYQFTTSSNGNLLSNLSTLGLTTVYEQLIQLVQQSGWYFYFDGNDKLIIGKFNQTLSPVKAKITEDDILSIDVIQHDKMLRNRAVVVGSFDPLFNDYASADISTTTKWNYDSRDKRAVVIFNNNIPNRSSAQAMANQLLTEFAKINIEKHIELHGARDYSLGDVISVKSRAFSGKGIITTYSVAMDRNGLVTRIVLDERCPRMFGFFNFGDYVYVSTFGSGIWRKHIQYDHTWHPFSSGLDQLAITDLHIANGIFSAVGTSGEMYYNLEDDTPWTRLPVSSLMSVPQSGLIYSGVSSGDFSEYFTQPYSGIIGRATIIDRENARILYAVDNYSGVNYGDYWMDLSGILWSHYVEDYSEYLYSGMIWSGGRSAWRGWILEYDPLIGELSDLPINVSGNFNVRVFDIETDGSNDYVSVMTKSGVITNGYPHYWGSTRQRTFLKSEFYSPMMYWDGGNSYPDPLYDISKGSYSFSYSVYYVENNLITHPSLFDGNYKFDLFFGATGTKAVLFTRGIWYTEDGNYPIDVNFEVQLNSSLTSGFVIRRSGLVFDVYSLGSEDAVINGESIIKIKITKLTVDFINNQYYGPSVIYEDYPFDDEKVVVMDGAIFIDGIIYVLSTSNWAVYQEYYGDGRDSYQYNASTPGTSNLFLYKLDTKTDSVSKELLISVTTPETGEGTYWRPMFFNSNLGSPNETYGKPGVLTLYARDGKCMVAGVLGFVRNVGNAPYTSQKHLKLYIINGSVDGFSSSLLIDKISDGLYDRFLNTYSSPVYSVNGVERILYKAQSQMDDFPDVVIDDSNVITGDNINGYIYPTNIISNVLSKGILEYGGSFYNYDYRYASGYPPYGELISIPTGYSTIEGFFIKPLGVQNSSIIYGLCGKTINGNLIKGFLVPYDINSGKWMVDYSFYSQIEEPSTSSYYSRIGINIGSWFISKYTAGIYPFYLFADKFFSGGIDNLVLKYPKGFAEYKIIDSGNFPIRVEISQFSPVLTAEDDRPSFNSITVLGSGVEIISPVPTSDDAISGIFVSDYRYTLLPDESGYLSKQGIFIADYPIASKMMAASWSGFVFSGIDESNQIRTFDVYTYSGVNNLLNVGYSGMLNKIETTNYAASGQYIFVTTSGETPMFYQKDPNQPYFIFYSGLPQSRATMIRVDDRL